MSSLSCFYSSPLLFQLIKEQLKPPEWPIIRSTLGGKLVDENEELQNEIKGLVDILAEYQQNVQQKVDLIAQRPREIEREMLKKQIVMFAKGLSEKSKAMVAPVLQYAKETIRRPMTASSGTRPSSSVSVLSARPSSGSSELSNISEDKGEKNALAAFEESSAFLIAELKAENMALLKEIERLHACLQEEIEFESKVKVCLMEPSIAELQETKSTITRLASMELEKSNSPLEVSRDTNYNLSNSINSNDLTGNPPIAKKLINTKPSAIRKRILDAKLFGMD